MSLWNLLFGPNSGPTEWDRLESERQHEQWKRHWEEQSRRQDEIRQENERYKQERAREEARSMIGTP